MLGNVIKLLPDNIANQIAAGEVVQRPSSVVKELLENSIDAGATQIQLIVKDAGKTLIQVIDNGCGMSDVDARMSFERHATSKISKANDLYAIRTMGFRGEALASIAAVAQVELRTKTADSDVGCLIQVEANEVLNQKPITCATGSSFIVKNLFYNVPARRNFLKSNPVEMRHVIDELIHVSMAHPEVQFSLHHNDIEIYHLHKQTLLQRIAIILGNSYKDMWEALDEDTSIVNVKGYIARPESAKKTRGDQYFFVNKRYIKSPYLHHAVLAAFDQNMSKEYHAAYVIFLDINPEKIDINVHPTKHEIKFEDERHVYTILNASVRKALGQILPATNNFAITDTNSYNPYKKVETPTFAAQTVTPIKNNLERNNQKYWEALVSDTIQHKRQEIVIASQIEPMLFDGDDHDSRELEPYQLHQQYILSPIRLGFVLIDQEAAHQRVLYERFYMRLQGNTGIVQQLLFPRSLNFSLADNQLIIDILTDINALGFDIRASNDLGFVVHGIPADILFDDEQKLLEQLLEQYKNNRDKMRMQHHENLAKSMALHGSIKRGKTLNVREMKQLIDELFACQQPTQSPFDAKTYIRVGLDELTNMFK